MCRVINAGLMVELGYAFLKKDENGNDTREKELMADLKDVYEKANEPIALKTLDKLIQWKALTDSFTR